MFVCALEGMSSHWSQLPRTSMAIAMEMVNAQEHTEFRITILRLGCGRQMAVIMLKPDIQLHHSRSITDPVQTMDFEAQPKNATVINE